jgi:hypothetical protein
MRYRRQAVACQGKELEAQTGHDSQSILQVQALMHFGGLLEELLGCPPNFQGQHVEPGSTLSGESTSGANGVEYLTVGLAGDPVSSWA